MKYILTILQIFSAIAILIAYMCNYNRTQLPIATMCLIMSVIFRPRS